MRCRRKYHQRQDSGGLHKIWANFNVESTSKTYGYQRSNSEKAIYIGVLSLSSTLRKAMTDLVSNPVLTVNTIYKREESLARSLLAEPSRITRRKKFEWKKWSTSKSLKRTYEFVNHGIRSIWSIQLCWFLQELTSPTYGIQSENAKALCRGHRRLGHLPPLQKRLWCWKGATLIGYSQSTFRFI